ncbi:Rad52/Rad22 family DNA repair protein [Streptomyces sp. NPDC004728]|uniref:Rad52/Rad22 family DNA repair protein n=1 Tax=Streptomyces sp. NPDC004728 TaxID=3154289 RepID=UPI0033B7F4D0
MATAVEAPASNTAEGPTPHTQNQTARFSPYQLRMLHGGINGNRVRNLRGMSHLEAWDVRRQLIRIFGFGGFDIETVSLDLVAEHEKKTGEKSRWTVVYRAQVRLILKDITGTAIAHFDDGAAGDSVNQPSLGDAHDMAMKTAFSQALKRCAVNLGDQFGLSLYNDGSQEPVVMFSAAHPPQEWKPQAQPPEPEPVDPPVRPEPSTPQDTEESAPTPQPAASAATGRDYLHEAHAAADAETVRAIYRAAKNDGAVPEYLAQIAQVGQAKASPATATDAAPAGPDPIDQLMSQVARMWGDHVELTKVLAEAGRRNQLLREVEGPVGGWVPFGDMVTARIAELKEQARQAEQNGPERSAA